MRSCSGGVWRGMGAFINGLKIIIWEVSMKFGARLHLKLAREPQYIISLGKVREDSDGDAIKIYTSLLSKAGKPAECVIQVCG